MYRQFSEPPGQLPDEYSRDHHRTSSVEGDDRRYKGLDTPMGGSLFAAYDPLDIMNAKYLIVASSDYLYTPRSLFWPDVIFLTAPKLDWGQAKGMAISVQRIISLDPQVIIIAGSNEGRFDVVILAPIRSIDPNPYQFLRSELPAVWADISNAIHGLKEHRRTHVVLDDVLGLKLSNFARLLKLRPGLNDDHVLAQQVANDLCFRQLDYEKNAQEKMVAESDVIRGGPPGTGL